MFVLIFLNPLGPRVRCLDFSVGAAAAVGDTGAAVSNTAAAILRVLALKIKLSAAWKIDEESEYQT